MEEHARAFTAHPAHAGSLLRHRDYSDYGDRYDAHPAGREPRPFAFDVYSDRGGGVLGSAFRRQHAPERDGLRRRRH